MFICFNDFSIILTISSFSVLSKYYCKILPYFKTAYFSLFIMTNANIIHFKYIIKYSLCNKIKSFCMFCWAAAATVVSVDYI